MRIGILSHYARPEPAAPAIRIEEFSTVWAGMGHEVLVLTSLPSHPTGEIYPAYRGRWLVREANDFGTAIRVRHHTRRTMGTLRTALSQLSLPAMATAVAAFGGVPRPDVWIATSPPLFIGLGGVALKSIHRVPLVFEVRDLWPDYFHDLGILRDGALLGFFYRLERRFYRAADLVVTLTDSAVSDVVRKGVDPGKVRSVPSGAVVAEASPPSGPERRASRRRWGVPDSAFVVGYLGTHGVGQQLHSLAPAVRELAREGVHVLFVGDGNEKPRLQEALEPLPPTVRLLPTVDRGKVPEFYGLCDVLLVPLGDFPTISRALPSKLFEILAYGRPVVGGVRGDAARIIDASGAGLVVEPEDPGMLVRAVRDLRARGADERARMGARGRRWVADHYPRRALAARYAEHLEALVGEVSPTVPGAPCSGSRS